ncbi:UNVERIFIED_CONTAM: hypothetical protein Scaly_1647400 [Sesamum calycinum]|uniref:Uncharacterized protein n=1 Tax=Sesamum calycinum TaxID=2727403 RepID=A0AAW2PC53_9LAMI
MTNELSNALQQKDQNIVNAIRLIVTVKDCLQHLRDNGWDAFLKEVEVFRSEKSILVSRMEDTIPIRGCSGREGQCVTFYYRYHAEIFPAVIDLLVVEIDNRFSEASTKLLKCISCLDPRNSCAKFDHDMLIHLAEIYSNDFSSCDIVLLKDQLETYIFYIR